MVFTHSDSLISENKSIDIIYTLISAKFFIKNLRGTIFY